MSDNAHVLQLLTAALESDRTPDEVCGEYPELLPEVRRRWEECQRMIGEIDMLFPMADTPADLEPELARYRTNHVPQIPGYELGPTLGRGGMGVVYQARHLGLNRTIALKMLLAGPYASSIELARFLREARAIAGLKHPNLV
jgi:eukaryotic-like serine/threonine-protein kinase